MVWLVIQYVTKSPANGESQIYCARYYWIKVIVSFKTIKLKDYHVSLTNARLLLLNKIWSLS